MKRLIVATCEQQDRDVLRDLFSASYEIFVTSDKEEFLKCLEEKHPDLAFIDVRLFTPEAAPTPQSVYLREMTRFWEASSAGPIVVIAPASHLREAVKAVKAGASNYLTSPIDPTEVVYVTDSLEEFKLIQLELDYLRDQFWKTDSRKIVATQSPPMKDVLSKIKLVAPNRTTVLLNGETGVGKTTLAKLIHRHSSRCDNQFISVHCGAIPDTLLESELFGHERGAFTGAVKRKLGKFEIANGGTIFLDEVGVMTPAAQIKLLAVIQDRVFQRVGGEKDIEVDVRIIAASNVDLLSLCEAGQFRTDLYFRLNVFPMDIPPLRDRKEDIPSLLWTFIEQLQAVDPKEIEDIDPRVLDALIRYNWPGNVRELEHLVERAFILENSPVLSPRSFPAELFRDSIAHMGSGSTRLTLAQYRDTNLGILEKQYLDALLRKHHGRIDQTAAAAGVGVRQLHKLMIRHQLKRGDYVKQ